MCFVSPMHNRSINVREGVVYDGDGNGNGDRKQSTFIWNREKRKKKRKDERYMQMLKCWKTERENNIRKLNGMRMRMLLLNKREHLKCSN